MVDDAPVELTGEHARDVTEVLESRKDFYEKKGMTDTVTAINSLDTPSSSPDEIHMTGPLNLALHETLIEAGRLHEIASVAPERAIRLRQALDKVRTEAVIEVQRVDEIITVETNHRNKYTLYLNTSFDSNRRLTVFVENWLKGNAETGNERVAGSFPGENYTDELDQLPSYIQEKKAVNSRMEDYADEVVSQIGVSHL